MGLANIDPYSRKAQTKSSSLVQIDPKVSKIQPFENVKICKEMYGHPDAVRHSVQMPYISLLIDFLKSLYLSQNYKIQPFENVKICKEMYGHPDAVRHSVRMPYISLLTDFFKSLYLSQN